MQSVGITQYRLVINPLTESYAMPLVTLPAEHMLFISSFWMVFQTIVFTVRAYGAMTGSINVVFSVITGLVYTWILKRSQPIQANIPTSIDSYKVLGIGLTAVLLCFLIF